MLSEVSAIKPISSTSPSCARCRNHGKSLAARRRKQNSRFYDSVCNECRRAPDRSRFMAKHAGCKKNEVVNVFKQENQNNRISPVLNKALAFSPCGPHFPSSLGPAESLQKTTWASSAFSPTHGLISIGDIYKVESALDRLLVIYPEGIGHTLYLYIILKVCDFNVDETYKLLMKAHMELRMLSLRQSRFRLTAGNKVADGYYTLPFVPSPVLPRMSQNPAMQLYYPVQVYPGFGNDGSFRIACSSNYF